MPFIYRKHRFRPFHVHVAHSFFVTPNEITDDGHVAGYFYRDDGVAEGFAIYPGDASPYPIYGPHAGTKPGKGTFIDSISNSDLVAGGAVSNHNRLRAFVTYEDEGPGSIVARTPKHPKSFTQLTGVNSNSIVVGGWYDAKHHHFRGLLGKAVHPRTTEAPSIGSGQTTRR
jgi:hypothetical protein